MYLYTYFSKYIIVFKHVIQSQWLDQVQCYIKCIISVLILCCSELQKQSCLSYLKSYVKDSITMDLEVRKINLLVIWALFAHSGT